LISDRFRDSLRYLYLLCLRVKVFDTYRSQTRIRIGHHEGPASLVGLAELLDRLKLFHHPREPNPTFTIRATAAGPPASVPAQSLP